MKPIVSFLLVFICFWGLVGCEDTSEAEYRILRAVAHFENAESNFSASATLDQLIVNGGWVDRMGEAIRELDSIPVSDSRTNTAVTSLRSEMLSRYLKRRNSLVSDARYLNAMHELELSTLWLQ